jgi:uncharacterized lipoprotein NlpE involved in copper resistance
MIQINTKTHFLIAALAVNTTDLNQLQHKIISIMKKIIFILLCLVFLLCGCKNAEQDVNDSIVYFYKNHHPDYRDVDKKLLSKDLQSLLEKTAAREDLEADWVAKSASPTDKPWFIESDIFASHLEGELSFAVNKITMNGNETRVVMDFTATLAATNDVEKWSEEVVLVYEGGWKVDDIIYPQGDRYLDGQGNLKKVLLTYVNMTSEEAHPK